MTRDAAHPIAAGIAEEVATARRRCAAGAVPSPQARISAWPASSCTGIVLQDGERVLVGNNEDWFNPRSKIWFAQPVADRYGSVFFGFDNYLPHGGMNQKGLFFDAFALKSKAFEEPEAKPRFKGNLIKEVMATCGTVEEALTLIDQYSLYFMDHFQLFFADAAGGAAIVEANAVIRKQGDDHVVTNFRQSEINPDKISCWRYLTARKLLAECSGDRLGCINHTLLTLEAARLRGLSIAALALGLAVGAVGTTLSRARKRLAKAYQEQQGEKDDVARR